MHAPSTKADESAQNRLWWPNEADRLVQLYEAGAVMSSGEMAAARREIASRERRKSSPPVIKRESLRFEPSSFKGVEIGYIVAPHLGIETRNVTLEVHRLLPGAHTELRRSSEALCHVLNGRGTAVLGGVEYEWGPHDTIHVQKGSWHQLINASDDEPAHILVGQASPILEFLSIHADVAKGDSYSDMPDDFKPEHPFTKERVEVGDVDGQKWMSKLQLSVHERRAEREKNSARSRVFMKAREVVIERSEHRGDWKVGLIDRYYGFDNSVLGMYVHQMPPDSHTETHKHGEAIVYVLSGRGYSLVEGERHEWRQGDCIFVQPGQWHQHFNSDPEEVSQHLALYVQPLKEVVYEGAESVEIVSEPGYDPAPPASTAPGQWWR